MTTTTTTTTTPLPMRYSIWYARQRSADDLSWVADAVTSLQQNKWDATTPVSLDGSGWKNYSSSDELSTNTANTNTTTDQRQQQAAATTLLSALADNTSARSLMIANAVLAESTEQVLDDLFARNKHLQVVSLRRLRSQSGHPFWNIPASLFTSPSLTDLTLGECTLDTDAAHALLHRLTTASPSPSSSSQESSSLSSLTTLTLEQVHILPEGWKCLTTALRAPNCSLRHLTIQNTKLSLEDATLLLQALKVNTSLQTLALPNLLLSDAHAAALADLLRYNTHLQFLSLRQNELTATAIDIICRDGLVHNQTLETLFLSHNPVGDTGVTSIVQALQINHTLRRLCLCQCEIWSAGCRAMAAGLPDMRGLQKLALDGNDVMGCAPEFLDALSGNRSNCHVTELLHGLPYLLQNNNVHGELNATTLQQWKEIDVYLKWNQAGRRVLSSEHAHADVLLPYVLAKSSHDVNILFQFLQATVAR